MCQLPLTCGAEVVVEEAMTAILAAEVVELDIHRQIL
jgi:hypothetical protein